jgi:hypothetical protein
MWGLKYAEFLIRVCLISEWIETPNVQYYWKGIDEKAQDLEKFGHKMSRANDKLNGANIL